jgi:hypothetical protein
MKQSLTNTQIEILKTFAHPLPDADISALRKTLANFFAERAIAYADVAWEHNEWDNEKVDSILKTKMRKRN